MHSSLRLLVLQHIRAEHPGIYREMFQRDGIHWDVIELDEGEALPSLDGYHGLWVMGGPMDVWQFERYPWLMREMEFIREAVAERQMPFLGFCLGHQLLASALGGQVRPSTIPEIGMMEIHLDAATESIFSGFPPTMQVLQWHAAEVRRTPENAQILASSPACAVQAMRCGPNAFSLQFHLEVSVEMLDQWGEIPEYKAALHKLSGASGAPGLKLLSAAFQAQSPPLRQEAERLYQHWILHAREYAR